MKKLSFPAVLVWTGLFGSLAQAKEAESRCERIKIQAIDWIVTSPFALSPDLVRQRDDLVYVTKDAQEIATILAFLEKRMAGTPTREPTVNFDTRLVVDCFKSEGHVETFVASAHELRRPPHSKVVDVDAKFRAFFTMDKDFSKTLKP